MNSVEDAEAAISILLDRGCKTVIITMGEKGAVVASTDNRTPIHVAATQVAPVDTTVSILSPYWHLQFVCKGPRQRVITERTWTKYDRPRVLGCQPVDGALVVLSLNQITIATFVHQMGDVCLPSGRKK